MNDVIREFLIETQENLAQLDLDLVTLEKDPADRETPSRVFRTLHTVKGTAGFLGLQKLQAVAHAAENLLSRLREGELSFDATVVGALLAVVDAVRQMLKSVEATETDGDADYSALIETLERFRAAGGGETVPRLHSQAERASQRSQARGENGPPVMGHDEAAMLAVLPSMDSSDFQLPIDDFRFQDLPIENRKSKIHCDSPIVESAPTGPTNAVAESTIRVDVGLLDKLMNLVGELVLARNQIMQFSTSQENTAVQGTVQRLNLLTTELQAGVMKTRMQPISTIWSKFPRVVRDLAMACGRRVRLELHGQDTELDKTIIEAIRDPLTHLVRNAIDHGIEPFEDRLSRAKPPEGRLTLHAFHEGGKVIIRITDDGAGIDPQRIRDKALRAKLINAEQADRYNDRELLNLVFLPGFSTAERVTQFSGRGVGMDVVRTNVERIGGTVSMESKPGQGTTVELKIPLTLAIIPALTITSGGDRFAIPQVSLLELVRLEKEDAQRGIELIREAPVYRLRGNLLPLVYLNRELQEDFRLPIDDFRFQDSPIENRKSKIHRHSPDGSINIVVLQADTHQFGLVVDAIQDTEEIVVKPLQKQIKGIGIFAGATIMGDGTVALILDVLALAQKANVITGIRERALAEKPANTADAAADRENVLLIGTKDGGRMAIPLSLVDRLEEFPRSVVERVGELDVVQYRGQIMPLIPVSQVLKGRRTASRSGRRQRRPQSSSRGAASRGRANNDQQAQQGTVQVIVYSNREQRVGLVVDQILDIAEEAILTRSSAHRQGVLSTAVIQGRITELLDVEGIVCSVESQATEPSHTLLTKA